MRGRDLFWAGFGLAAVFLQLPVTKMILDDPQALHLGVWNVPTFLFFSLITFAVVPVCLGLVLAALFKTYPKTCCAVLAIGLSVIVATEINSNYLKLHFPQAPWRHPLFAALVLLPVIPLIRFREQVVRLFKIAGWSGPVLFAYFAAHASPVSLAMSSSPALSVSAAPAALQDAPLIFVLTFEKLVANYLTDGQGAVLKDFPNLARFAQEADYYPHAYSNSTATVYALKTLYSGRYWTKERRWMNQPTVASILGAGRRTYMLLDVLTEYCRPPATCIRTVGQERLTSVGLVSAYYKGHLGSILPEPVKVRLVRAFDLRGGFDLALDIYTAEDRSYSTIGRQQLERLHELVQAQGEAPALYIMHNFISNDPPVLSSMLPGAQHSQNEAVRLEELAAVRGHLMPFDAAVGEFLGRLKASGLYDRSLILITSDTGYDPWQRGIQGRRAELPVTPDDLMRIFLAIKRPRQREGRILSAPIRHVDVLPTILSHLGIDPAPFHFEGIAVTSPGQAQDLAQRPLKFSVTSARAGILHYLLTDPHGPLRRIK